MEISKETRTSGFQLVSCDFQRRNGCDIDMFVAFAGASATIASDALMNPFDGKRKRLLYPFHYIYTYTWCLFQ